MDLWLFPYKNISQISFKIFVTQYFFTDHLKHKTVNQTTRRTPSANPHQLCTKLVEELSNCYVYFLRLSVFPDLFSKVFLITCKFSLFESLPTFLQEQCK